jgi:hypothetical protein
MDYVFLQRLYVFPGPNYVFLRLNHVFLLQKHVDESEKKAIALLDRPFPKIKEP